MRVLLLFRGAPGCGKSTFIEKNGLKPYTLCADDIRLLCQSPKQNTDGLFEISQDNEKDVWAMLFKLLEIRMEKGEFTVIDATNSKAVEINRYKEMAEHYRYRIFCIDMTSIPIDVCKAQNAGRSALKRVPESVIDKMYSRFKTQKIPSGVKVIKPDELNTIFLKKFDMSKYEKIVHIGDIHGCYTALMEYFKNGFNDNYFYIFVGDIIDRGIENAEVVKFFIEAVKRPNVLLLEGNHERWLWIYANGGVGKSKEFEFVTKKQLDAADIDKKDIRQLYRKCGQCAWYSYGDKNVFVSHGGVATLNDNVTKLATHQFIHGVGKYDDFEKIADSWMINAPENYYQIHGHRNTKNCPIRIRDRVFNLEGSVEFGGDLRIVELDKDGFHEISIKNTVFKKPEEVTTTKLITDSSVADVVLKLRQNKYINEKQFGNISSFNFTNNAFYDKIWTEQTVVARGLYINTNLMKVMCRGFNKFFNINERPETKFDMLKYTLQFPVTCYVKENGFLGIVSYNEETDDLFITTKSNPDGDYAQWMKNMFYEKISKQSVEEIKKMCKEENVTFVFECVDTVHDPHIIEYPESNLYLLSIIKNDINFAQYDYEHLQRIGTNLGLNVKVRAFELKDWAEFFDWYNEVMAPDYEYFGNVIEGFVIEDSVGYMTKLKLTYYNFWKYMRGVAHETLRKGYIQRTGTLTTAEANNFYGFCQNLYKTKTKEEIEALPKDIISLRNMFYAQ